MKRPALWTRIRLWGAKAQVSTAAATIVGDSNLRATEPRISFIVDFQAKGFKAVLDRPH